ncbi:F-box protein At3g12350-like [Cornus florida]|uniref:F-box protein At3g12350-like n=1 Tax=Cornus florida TaxID=4283 RepID=UPI002898D600|nr:F-box protein At3g12350-like [Cornus florida]
MANLHVPNELISFPFSDLPEDVQVCILSFLTPSEIASFACTSKRSSSLCQNDGELWFSMCDRRWGSSTQIDKWGNGKITYKQLYKTLAEYENLIGFWRRSGNTGVNSPPLVFFEWGPSFITGSRVSPSKAGSYRVMKAPFLWISVASNGEPVNFLDPECRFELSDDLINSGDLIRVNIGFMGKSHVVVEEHLSFAYSNSPMGRNIGFGRVSSLGNVVGEEYGVVEDVVGAQSGSLGTSPDRLMSEIYQYFANRTNPGGDRASRKQRKREKERQGRRKWEPEHFVKIVNCSPTALRPLQGLWKGICDDMNLDFYLVAYDDIGGIACRRVGDSSTPFSGYSPVFWTSNTKFIESPFSFEEENLYDSRKHLRSLAAADHIQRQTSWTENEAVSRILYINSSYDLVLPDLVGTSNPRHVEGRIWQYRDGTFGFGFIRDNYIIDLKHIAQNGCLLDSAKLCSD